MRPYWTIRTVRNFTELSKILRQLPILHNNEAMPRRTRNPVWAINMRTRTPNLHRYILCHNQTANRNAAVDKADDTTDAYARRANEDGQWNYEAAGGSYEIHARSNQKPKVAKTDDVSKHKKTRLTNCRHRYNRPRLGRIHGFLETLQVNVKIDRSGGNTERAALYMLTRR